MLLASQTDKQVYGRLTHAMSRTNLSAVDRLDVDEPAIADQGRPTASTESVLVKVLADVWLHSVVLARQQPSWQQHVYRRLGELGTGVGDFTGLAQPSPEVVQRARGVAAAMFDSDTPAPSVMPTEEGAVVYVW